MSLSQEGLRKGRRVVEAASEAGIYHALGLPFIAPELREGRDEFEIMSKPLRLVEMGDLRGVLHAHTDRSDGTDTLEAMAEAARSRGYRYLGVTDHSQSAHYAGGLTTEEILAQHRDVDRLNRRYGDKFRIFKGIESDIRPTAPWIIPRISCAVSISLSRACIANSAWRPRSRRRGSSERWRTPIPPSWAI